MTLLLSSFPGQSCSAQINFHSPVSLQTARGLSFVAKGSSPDQAYTVELIEDLHQGDAVGSSPFSVGRQWTPDGLRFNRLKKDWNPKQLAAVRWISLPRSAWRRRTVFPLYIRVDRSLRGAFSGVPR
jgi:hypothetical protein